MLMGPGGDNPSVVRPARWIRLWSCPHAQPWPIAYVAPVHSARPADLPWSAAGRLAPAGPVAAVAIVGSMGPSDSESEPAVAERELPTTFPAGHYYSAIPSVEDVEVAMAARTLGRLPGIDVDREGQLALVAELGAIVHDHPFRPPFPQGLRYEPDNGFFGISDALLLHAMLRWARPAKLVEVGSGWSSACILDTDERFLGQSTRLTFIDPDPVRLDAILTEADEAQPGRITIHRRRLQEIPDSVLLDLAPRDILFIDSSHVAKAGSDVNQLLLDIVPRLPAGVLVHVHDIPFPFEYDRVWIEEGRYWSEAYLLRALLTDNPRLRIRLFNNYLATHEWQAVHDHLPGWTGDGLSIWLEVVSGPETGA